jgi:ribosomal protein S18 acetylase RimI-like enzyme
MKRTEYIRPAVSSDCDRLTDLATVAYERYLKRMDKKPAPMTEDYAKRVTEGCVFALEIRSARPGVEKSDLEPQVSSSASPTIAGFIVLLPEKDALLLDNVAVDPAVQGRGYGKMLMAFAEEHARKAGFRRIILYTNEVMTENLQLYPRLGYMETHRAREGGFNRVFFSKIL